MPLYEYICEDCDRVVTLRRRFSESSRPTCPVCGGLRLSRLISQVAVVTSKQDRTKDLSWVDQALSRRLRKASSGRRSPRLEEALDELASG